MPPAPPTFSMMICWPSVALIAGASTRATTSLGPPAANVTTRVNGRVGQSCAASGITAPASTSAAASVTALFRMSVAAPFRRGMRGPTRPPASLPMRPVYRQACNAVAANPMRRGAIASLCRARSDHPCYGATSRGWRRAMRILVLAFAVAAALAGAHHAAAETYPARSITLVVPFPAGGPTDTLARIMAQRMTGPLGQSMIIENVSGANGGIGAGRVARAARDGYTLILANWNSQVANGAVYTLQY